MECCKVVFANYAKDKKVREAVENFEQWRIKQLYQNVLFDDGRSPSFQKDALVKDRQEINDIVQSDIKLSSKNMRGLKTKGGRKGGSRSNSRKKRKQRRQQEIEIVEDENEEGDDSSSAEDESEENTSTDEEEMEQKRLNIRKKSSHKTARQ